MSQAKRVLVAEDNIVLGDVIRFNLQRSGFQVTLARNGNEALRLAAAEPFEVLVTDFEMPGMDGEELCTRVRNDLKLENLRIVMCSAKGLELDRDEIMARLRIETILFKPFSMRELSCLLERLMSANDEPVPQLVAN
jgi:CheY-like chemotaxis protein